MNFNEWFKKAIEVASYDQTADFIKKMIDDTEYWKSWFEAGETPVAAADNYFRY